MEWMTKLFDWFAGGSYQYFNLYHCMRGDRFWIAVTVVLDLAVAAGYGLIAMHWWRNQRTLPPTPARAALGNMRNIFLFCGICGYVFIPIKMFWPAWRLYDLFMVVLVYFTWKYAWGARDLKVVYNELGRSNRLAEDLARSKEDSRRKNLFLNAISHDLRTPLNGLVLQANVAELTSRGDDAEGLREALAEIKSSAHAAAAMLEQFLEYARVDGSHEELATEIFPLSDLIRETLRTFEARAAQKGLELSSAVPGQLLVRSDRARLGRILANLIDNALKFTQRGSVRVVVESAGDGVELHVIDTGIGIAAADRARLFDEFFQVHNHERDRAKGFGLGLSIARGLARQLGGDVTVESALGAGSRFSLSLPGVVAVAGRAGAPTRAPLGPAAVPAAG